MRGPISTLACASLVLGGSVSVPTTPAQAQTYNSVADDACWKAVVREARGQFAADGVDQLSLDERQGAQVETIAYGTGQANGTNFNYECTYNVRTARTYGVSVTSTGGGGGYTKPDNYPSQPIADRGTTVAPARPARYWER